MLDKLTSICYTNIRGEIVAKNLRIKSARAALDISQEELAKKSGVMRQTISDVENGEYNPTIKL